MTARILLALALMLMLRPAIAQEGSPLDVQLLLQDCQEPIGSPARGLCTGYISGVGDMMMRVAYETIISSVRQSFGACGHPSADAKVQTFINWAEKNPQKWDEPTVDGVMDALQKTWPCRGDD